MMYDVWRVPFHRNVPRTSTWFSSGLARGSRRLRRLAFAISELNLAHKIKYYSFLKYCRSCIRTARFKFTKALVDRASSSSKKLWQLINNSIVRSNDNNSLVHLISADSAGSRVLNDLAEFFASIGAATAGRLSHCPPQFHSYAHTQLW